MIIESKDYSYSEICKIINQLKNEYDFLQSEVIGKSVLGRNIYSLKIGNASENVLFAAAFHGSERITALIMLKFINELCDCVKNNKNMKSFNINQVLKTSSITVVPLVNPDGCEIARGGCSTAGDKAAFIKKISKNNTLRYNANAHGVDINHNFPAGWNKLHCLEQQNGIYGPSATRYGGSAAASEPETVSLIKLCEKINFKHILAFHSQGEVIYHRYNKYLPKAEKLAQLLSTSSGYALEESEGLAVGGGFKDYFIEKYSKPAFTIEVGKGENPLDSETAEDIYEKIKEMLVISIMM